jgi:septal ring factor EnvC (AmiA/AmiB activator)
MTAGNEDSVAVLYAAYVDEAEQYATALRLAGETAAACRRGEKIEDRLNQVLNLLTEIGRRDSLLASVKQRWEQAGRPTNHDLRSAMDRIAALIVQIQRELQTLEQAVQARRDRLADELDACNRSCRMQRAYQRKS